MVAEADDVQRHLRQTLELHTHGGSRLEKFAGAIMTVSLLIVGFATLQPEVVIVAFAIYGAFEGLVDIITRLDEGTFEWDLQTGMDILGIAGGITAVASPIVSTVRGFGEVAWLGTSARALGVIQIVPLIAIVAGLRAIELRIQRRAQVQQPS